MKTTPINLNQILMPLATMLVLLGATTKVQATSYTLTNSGAWNVSANWNPNGVPTTADTAIVATGKSITGLGGTSPAVTILTIQGTGTVTVDAGTLTVSGVTTIGSSGAANLTIASGATFASTSTASGAYVFGGTSSSITNNGTFTCTGGNGSGGTTPIFANNGIATFTGSQQSFNSAVAVIQGANAVLNLNSSSTTPWGGSSTLNASASGNTVSYGANGPNVKATPYYNLSFTGSSGSYSYSTSTTVAGTLTVGGTTAVNNVSGTFGAITLTGGNVTLNAVTTISGNLIVNGGTFYAQISSGSLTVSGTTAVNGGTLELGSLGSGSATFTGDFSMSSGSFNSSFSGQNPAVNFGGNLTVNGGAFTAGTGINTFSGTGKTITGTISIPKVTINGTITNAGTLTVSTALAGSGTLTQNANSVLNIGGTSSGLTLAASVNTPNTVSYTSTSAQTVLGANYDSLTVSGASAKTLAGNATVGSTLTLTAGTLNLNGNTLSAGSISRTSGSILLAVTVPTVTKVYDGGTTPGIVTVGTLSGFVTGQTVTATGTGSTYSSANVGSTYANTISYALANGTGGGLAVNYSLSNSVIANATITKAPLSVTAPTVTKVYDGGTTPGIVTVGTLSGFIGAQTVTATGTGTAYSSANVGSTYANTISYTLVNGANGGLTGNYSLANSVIANAAITPKALSITAPTITKVYDGTTTAGTVTVGTLSGFVGSETVTATGIASPYSSANVGSAYPSTVSYTLADGTGGGLAANYSLADSVIADAAITPATPVVSWSDPADITYGTALDGTQLNAISGGVAGNFDYTPTSGTVLNAGASQTLSVQFTPTDTADYNTPDVKTVSINVLQASSSITFVTPTNFIYNGTAQTPSFSITGSTGLQSTNYVGITPTSYGPSSDAPTNTGTYGLTNTILSDANYIGATNGLEFTIDQTNLTVTAQPNTKVYDGNTSATSVPTLTSGTLAGGDGFATLFEVYADPAVGTGKTLIPSASITNLAGVDVTADYAITFVNDLTGVINSSCSAPVIVGGIDPDNTTVCAGSSLMLTLTNVAGTAPLFYQWQTNGVDIIDATNAIYTNLSVTLADMTNYVCVVSNSCGMVTSLVATVVVNPTPMVSVDSTMICAGDAATLTASTSASNPSYQWNDPANSTTASITVSPSSTTTYTVTVVDGVTGCANSSSGTVTVNSAIANDVTYNATIGYTFNIAETDLLAHASGSGGVTLTEVQSPSANGVLVTNTGGEIFYLANVTNMDTFTYTVASMTGDCTATGTVTLNPIHPVGSAKIGIPINGVVTIQFFGIPGTNYVVETATNIIFTPYWPLSTNTAGSDGSWLFMDPNATNQQQYYRSTWKP